MKAVTPPGRLEEFQLSRPDYVQLSQPDHVGGHFEYERDTGHELSLLAELLCRYSLKPHKVLQGSSYRQTFIRAFSKLPAPLLKASMRASRTEGPL